eukprot:TRINITY_DN3789_c0_g1_i5.p1 TRINITY_DN3789_c0_g1~~TRINITY_DN3789_c0_g1_i5.p1  ORF type:complete len:361 (+),score=75.31 TRINITY_DN3789_c0_g1_i5:146-1228(+)
MVGVDAARQRVTCFEVDTAVPDTAPSPPRYLFNLSAVTWAHISLFVVAFTFSGMNVMVQQALPSSSIGASVVFAFLRDVTASPVLTAAMLFTGQYVRPKSNDLVKLLVFMGAIGMSGTQTFFVLGLNDVGSDIAAVYSCMGPSVMFVLSIGLRLDKFSWLKMLGALFGGASIAVMSELWDISFSQQNELLGHVFLFSSVLFAQFFIVVQKYVHGYPPLMMTTVAYWAAVCTISIPAVIVTITHDGPDGIWPTSAFQWGTVVYSGVVSSAFNYYLIVFAIRQLSPLVVTIYGVFQPLITILLNYVFVGKDLSMWVGVGFVLSVLSVLLIVYSQVCCTAPLLCAVCCVLVRSMLVLCPAALL